MNASADGQIDETVIVEWLREQAIPLRQAEPCGDNDDLRRLVPALHGARVLGLGEANHGTREFMQVKDRLFRFLVQELGFTAFAIEAPYATARAVDDYVRHGVGEPGEVLTGLRYLPWDNEELTSMLGWMRHHNELVPEERKVRFWGVDVTFTGAGADFVLEFLHQVAPERVDDVEPALRLIVESDEHFPNSMEQVDTAALLECVPVLQDLRSFMRSERDRLEAATSTSACDDVDMLLTVMVQSCSGNGDARSRHMAENLLQLLGRSGGGAKAVFWAHNGHVGRAIEVGEVEQSAGVLLAERYGKAYTSWQLECGHGMFQTRSSVDGRLGSLAVSAITTAPVGSLPWYLEQVGPGVLFIDPRRAEAPEEVALWIREPLRARDAGWAAIDPADAYGDLVLAEACDGIIFVREVTPARPSSQARLNAEEDRGL